MRYHCMLIRMAKIKIVTTSNAGEYMEELHRLCTDGANWNGGIVTPKNSLAVSYKSKHWIFSSNPGVTLLGMYPREKGNWCLCTKSCTWTFIVALFVNSQTGSNPGILQQVSGYTNWYIHAMEHYLAIQINRLLICEKPGWIWGELCLVIKKNKPIPEVTYHVLINTLVRLH